MRNTVCLIGRPNTGKSTLFNRIIKERKAIVYDTPGLTRDRIYGLASFNGKKFHLIDTGGIDLTKETFNENIKLQAEIAIDESDVVVFVIDGKEELTSNDFEVANMLKKNNKKVIVAINKLDIKKHDQNIYNYYELGFEKYIGISSEHNRGIKDLLEEITKDFKTFEENQKEDILNFSIIGRPNTGKSSLINALLNEERVLVSPKSGTTRDAIDTQFTYQNKKYNVIDTAGLRKKGRIYEQIEKYSLIRTLKAIDRSDVCVLLLDAEMGILEHDKHIASYALDAGKGIVIAVNKWDLIKNKEKEMKKMTLLIKENFKFIPYASIIFLSALTKSRIHTLMPEVIKAYANATKEIKTSIINDIIREAVIINPPPSFKKQRLKIYFVSQVDSKPPKFEFSVNNKKLVHFSYKRYLENQIRQSIDFDGTPIILKFRNRGSKDE